MGIVQRSGSAPDDELVAGLLRGEAYGAADETVAHLETHISHVFLIGEHAYKIKKSLDLGFLDFSTLEKRRQACEEELRINCRTSPDLYLAVVPITGTRAQPRVEGAGTALEYAVKMLRFAQDDLLDRVFERGALTGKLIDPFAAQLARFHGAVSRAAPGSRHGDARSIIEPAEQNFTQLAPLLDEAADGARLERIRQWTARQHALLAAEFASRQQDGFVRECHGDLHLGNLVLIRGAIRMFDAIEFNDALRWIDVISEVAFLVMDLRLRGRADLAARFLNAYLETTGDYAGVRVLPYYVVYRALVRAKVAAMRARQPGLSDAQAESYRAKCRAHLDFAERCIDPPPAMLVMLHGLSGSGKTACSQILLEALEAVRVRSDVERKRLHGMTAGARSGASVGAGIYRDEFSERTYAHLLTITEAMLGAGQSVIVDATFLQAARRAPFFELARRLGVPLAIASFTAPEAILRERVRARAKAQKDASEADVAVLEHQLLTQEPLDPDEQARSVTIDTSAATAADIRAGAARLRDVAAFA